MVVVVIVALGVVGAVVAVRSLPIGSLPAVSAVSLRLFRSMILWFMEYFAVPLMGAAIVGCSLGPTHGGHLSAGSMVRFDMLAFLEDVGARSRTVAGRSAGPMAGW